MLKVIDGDTVKIQYKDESTRADGGINNIKQLLQYLQQELPEGFWGNVIVKFKDGVPYLVEEQRQIKLDKAR